MWLSPSPGPRGTGPGPAPLPCPQEPSGKCPEPPVSQALAWPQHPYHLPGKQAGRWQRLSHHWGPGRQPLHRLGPHPPPPRGPTRLCPKRQTPWASPAHSPRLCSQPSLTTAPSVMVPGLCARSARCSSHGRLSQGPAAPTASGSSKGTREAVSSLGPPLQPGGEPTLCLRSSQSPTTAPAGKLLFPALLPVPPPPHTLIPWPLHKPLLLPKGPPSAAQPPDQQTPPSPGSSPTPRPLRPQALHLPTPQ